MVVSDHVTWRAIGHEVVVLNIRSSEYYSLSETASCIWRGLVAGLTTEGLVSSVQECFDVPLEVAGADTAQFLAYLRAEGLLVDDQAPAPAG